MTITEQTTLTEPTRGLSLATRPMSCSRLFLSEGAASGSRAMRLLILSCTGSLLPAYTWGSTRVRVLFPAAGNTSISLSDMNRLERWVILGQFIKHFQKVPPELSIFKHLSNHNKKLFCSVSRWVFYGLQSHLS